MTASRKNELTESQAKVLKTVSDFIAENGYSPTAKEIADILHVTQTSVFEQLERLEKKRYITRQKGAARTIGIMEHEISAERPVKKSDSVKLVKVPIIGTIAAGVPDRKSVV